MYKIVIQRINQVKMWIMANSLCEQIKKAFFNLLTTHWTTRSLFFINCTMDLKMLKSIQFEGTFGECMPSSDIDVIFLPQFQVILSKKLRDENECYLSKDFFIEKCAVN